MAKEKHEDNIKKDTRAIKKILIKTMNPLNDEDEEKDRPTKFKLAKQSLSTLQRLMI
jgi:hypothetical protein